MGRLVRGRSVILFISILAILSLYIIGVVEPLISGDIKRAALYDTVFPLGIHNGMEVLIRWIRY